MNLKSIGFDSDPADVVQYIDLLREELAPRITKIDLLEIFSEKCSRYVIYILENNGEFLCTNAFIFLKFVNSGRELLGCQSCFSATSQKHRGKGLWLKLMELAEADLYKRGGAFIFGFPNKISFPIFYHKLSYTYFSVRNYFIYPRLIAKLSRPKYRFTVRSNMHPEYFDLLEWKKYKISSDPVFYSSSDNGVIVASAKEFKVFGLPLCFPEILAIQPSGNAEFESALYDFTIRLPIPLVYLMLPIHSKLYRFGRIPASRAFPIIYKTLDTKLEMKSLYHLMLFRASMDIF
jgi:hypothetical protein